MRLKIYRCPICGNIIIMAKNSGVIPFCCGKQMEELVANTTDAATEKHIPQYEIKENEVKVQVGSVIHPMIDAHYIEWILLETNSGYQLKYLYPEEEPIKTFALSKDEKIKAIYSYCNLHGLWKQEIA